MRAEWRRRAFRLSNWEQEGSDARAIGDVDDPCKRGTVTEKQKVARTAEVGSLLVLPGNTAGVQATVEVPDPVALSEALAVLGRSGASIIAMIGEKSSGADWVRTFQPHLFAHDLGMLFTTPGEFGTLGSGIDTVIKALESKYRMILVVLDFSSDHKEVRKIDGECVGRGIPVVLLARQPSQVPLRIAPPLIYKPSEVGSPDSHVGRFFRDLIFEFYLQVKLRRCDDLVGLGLTDMAVLNAAMVLEHALRGLAKRAGEDEEIVAAKSIWTVVDALAKPVGGSRATLRVDRHGLERVINLGNAVRHSSYIPTPGEAKDVYDRVLAFVHENVMPDLRSAGIVPPD